ncbi:MAG: hypothetical protein IT383_18390 [Deltaproteobacteria bacterium]|nr:hypothetical protein [Deltaproteobacteria bacterium]
MPVITRTPQRLPTLSAQDTAQTVAQKIQAEGNLGTKLSKVEQQWIGDVVTKFGSSPEVQAALARLLGSLKPGEADKLGASTLATIRGGQTPVVPGAKTLPVAVAGIPGVQDADAAINPGKAKQHAEQTCGLTREQVGKYVKKPSDLFRGVVEIDPKNMIPDAQLAQLLGGTIAIETHTNQYATAPGKMGNNVLLNGANNAELIAALEKMQDTGIFVKDMTHREQGVWVAGPENDKLGVAFKDDRGVKGTTHRGSLDVGVDASGNKQVIFTDWPVGYGHHLNGNYTPLVSRWSIDDMRFSGTPPSAAEKKSYYDTVKSYELLFAMGVPFTNNDTRTGFNDYHFSPMEDLTPQDMGSRLDLTAKVLAGDANAATEMRDRTFYCAEGIVACIHAATMVPLNKASVDKGLMKPETLDYLKKMDTEFRAATADYSKPAELGWKAVLAKKLITQEQYDKLVQQNMQHRPFKLSLDGLPPLKDKGALDVDANGLIVKPQHIGGLVQGMMATAFPRESIAKGLAQRLAERVQAAGAQGAAITAGVANMLGLPAQTPLPQLAAAFGWAIGAKFQAQMLGSAEMQKTMKDAMGYDHMDPPSKTKVDNMIKEYIAVVGDPRLDRAALDAKLRELNDKAEKTEVNFPALNWKGLIRHVPPQGSRDVLLGVDGTGWAGLRPAFDILDKSMGT